MKAPRKVFFSLGSPEIGREFGRLPYPLFQAFAAAGYEVTVQRSVLLRRLLEEHKCTEAELPQASVLTLSVPGVRYADALPADPDQHVYVFDRPDPQADRLPWHRRIRVRFDLFSPYRLKAPLIAPYTMYPGHAARATPAYLSELRQRERHMRVFFAGDSQGYVRRWVNYPRPKIPRHELLTGLRADVPDALAEVRGIDETSWLAPGQYARKFVLCDSGSGVPQPLWLQTVASADFFLCPPGIVMPMCHNVIEAMAVGTIPLIGYPEWFHPGLEHGRNCIAFDGREDAAAKMRMVLDMPREQIEQLRAAVIDYFESHLQPVTLVRAIESRSERDLDVLIYTELNMARNAKRLGPRSVLMRGPDAGGPWRWLGRMLSRRLA